MDNLTGMGTGSLIDSIRGGDYSSITTLLIIMGLIVLSAVVLVNIAGYLVRKVVAKSKMDASVGRLVVKAVSFLLWALVIIIVAGWFGIPVNSLIVLLSVAGIALSLSVQGLLTNVFSGVTILVTKPLSTGDSVELGGVSGTVREIGLTHTILTTPDNKTVYIPNGKITDSNVVNFSREPKRRIEFVISLDAEPSLEDVRRAVMEAVRNDARIHGEPAPVVFLRSFGEGKAEYSIRVWVDNAQFLSVSADLMEAIRMSLRAGGIGAGQSQVVVFIKNDESGNK